MTEHVSVSTLMARLNREFSIQLSHVYINLTPAFQRSYECWDNKTKIVLIETILVGRALNPIYVVVNDDDNELQYDMVDGLHRVSTIRDFIENKFKLNGNFFLDDDFGERYNGKYFRDFTPTEQSNFRIYSIQMNILDVSYHHDKVKLQNYWQILNRAGSRLNVFEFDKMVYGEYFNIITEYKEEIAKSGIFHTRKDHRGYYESQINDMLALSSTLPSSWASITSVCKKYMEDELGKTPDLIKEKVTSDGDKIRKKLETLAYILNEMEELFKHGKFSSRERIYHMMVARCLFHFKTKAIFVKLRDELVSQLLDIFKDDIMKIPKNAKFQRLLIEKVDEVNRKLYVKHDTKRLFPPHLIDRKIAEQDNKCTMCTGVLGQDCHGDHIIPWTDGGETTYENLQVLHSRCHRKKC
jgi:hypothetical protein